jgi:hypothetical protein
MGTAMGTAPTDNRSSRDRSQIRIKSSLTSDDNSRASCPTQRRGAFPTDSRLAACRTPQGVAEATAAPVEAGHPWPRMQAQEARPLLAERIRRAGRRVAVDLLLDLLRRGCRPSARGARIAARARRVGSKRLRYAEFLLIALPWRIGDALYPSICTISPSVCR